MKPKTMVCPKCDLEAEVEVIRGRKREVTTVKPHIANGRVCFAIIGTKEKH